MGLQQTISKGIAGVALVMLVAACSHSGEPMQEPGHATAARPAAPAPARAVVALPTLLKLPVDGLARHLGPPRPVPASVRALLSQLPSADLADSTRFFRFRNLEMLVSYDAGTRRCDDLLLLGANEDLLMQRAGLSAEARNYLLLPVFHARRPMQMLGLRVVPVDPAQLQ